MPHWRPRPKEPALNPFTLVLTALALSADAFAASAGRGLSMRRFAWPQALWIAGACGVFQGLMPVVGWALGRAFTGAIAAADHWIAFAVLAGLGLKLWWEAWHSRGQADARESLSVRQILMLALATSVDALAAGVSLAFLQVNIALAAAVIAAITTVVCLGGVAVGHLAGRWLARFAEFAGGLLLIGIGVKILVEHLSAGI